MNIRKAITISTVILLFSQISQAQFAPYKILAEPVNIPWDMESGDFNNDGFVDVVYSTAYDSLNIYLLLNDKEGGFQPPITIIEDEAGRGYYFGIGDLNGDGNLDVVGNGGPSTYLLYGNGDGSFQSPILLDGFGLTARIFYEIVDLDNNGHQDIVTSFGLFGDGAVSWISNLGNDNYESREVIFDGLVNSYFIKAGDLDGDEFPNIVVAQSMPDPLFSFQYDGNGGFVRTDNVMSGMEQGAEIHIEDLNYDGIPDIVVPDDAGRDLYFHFDFNNSGTLFGFDILEMTKTAFEFDFADMDADGIIDLVVGTSASTTSAGQIILYPGIPTQKDWPEFDAPIILADDISAISFEMVDFDRDGDIDIVANSEAYSWQNQGVLTESLVYYIQNLSNDQAINGFVYHDENNSGEFEMNEDILENIQLNIEPAAIATFSQSDGSFNIYVGKGTYEITPDYGKCYGVSSEPAVVTVDYDGTNSIDDIEFGLDIISNEENLDISMASAATRCGFDVPFWINLNNTGCQTVDGEIVLRKSDLASLLWSDPLPTESDIDTWTWEIGDLKAGQHERIDLSFNIADASFIGDTIRMAADLFIENGPDLTFIERYNFLSEINCAYDPNDKQSYPQRSSSDSYDENYTLFDETIDYTIRFQNTGTDTAFNIVIRDTLSDWLDINSFHPLGASDRYETEIDYNSRSVSFHFRDILLVDSFTNEALSHGFVQFSIEALENIPEETLLENKAEIYFDFNEAIVTNTVDNLMVSELPTTAVVNEHNFSIQLSPNPIQSSEVFTISKLPVGKKKIQILNSNSNLIRAAETEKRHYEFNNCNLVAGVYFVTINVDDKSWIEKLVVL